MSSRNGDKSRFHRERKRKIARRQSTRALRQKLASRISHPSAGDSLKEQEAQG